MPYTCLTPALLLGRLPATASGRNNTHVQEIGQRQHFVKLKTCPNDRREPLQIFMPLGMILMMLASVGCSSAGEPEAHHGHEVVDAIGAEVLRHQVGAVVLPRHLLHADTPMLDGILYPEVLNLDVLCSAKPWFVRQGQRRAAVDPHLNSRLTAQVAYQRLHSQALYVLRSSIQRRARPLRMTARSPAAAWTRS